MAMRTQLQAMLDAGHETALLRFSLGEICFKVGEAATAVEHLARAVALDPDYSAAWKLYGRALAGCGRSADAKSAFSQGIKVAQARGDKQAAKEMRVFCRRLDKTSPAAARKPE